MELEKHYNPADYEAGIYKMWEESGAFQPSDSDKEPFSIVMPPPNANGHIHVGTAMFTIEDIMVRYQRMQGRPTLWLPGTDHAGIETQVVFERELAKEGKSRFDFTPEEFYKAVMTYTKSNQTTILSELKSLGFSADWSRLKFTLDDDIIEIVYDTFKKLHDDGLVYRGNRIVNWCPRCNAGFADIEIKHRDQIDPLYYIKYGPFVIATVRPETKFGDTAIAVHPKDERYQKYIGQEVEVEGLLGNFKLKVIGDAYVNPEFGTGVVKVTPAHDPNDWEMGLRHNLEVVQVIGTDGKLTEVAGRYAGMPAAEARVQVAHDLEERGLMDHIEMDYSHSIAYHDRCGTPIEPLVTEQWWLKVKPLVEPAIKAVRDKDTTFVPKRFEKSYIDWLDNLRDWNLSRQIWWGIRIPVYYRASGTVDHSSETTNPDLRTTNLDTPDYIIGTEADAIKAYGEGNYEAETDTFDTWFSSSQWPFATLMTSGDFDRFYPTSVMETGRDILFLWVTRMMMLGLYRTGKVPFKTVYLHGMVNDEHGKKMSKSKGNVTNPLDLTKEFGSDALRLALTIGITPGNDGALGKDKVAGYRNFCNKLWNVARFILSQLPEDYSPALSDVEGPAAPSPTTLADRWIMDALSQANKAVTKAINDYRFSEAGAAVYSLLWDDFADWYIEASKVEPNVEVMVHGLETILALLHPFAPFVTEAIWQKMAWHKQGLIVSSWPESDKTDAAARKVFEGLIARVKVIREMKALLGSASNNALKYSADDDIVIANPILFEKLAGLVKAEKHEDIHTYTRVPGYDILLQFDPEKIKVLLTSTRDKIEETTKYLEIQQSKMDNPNFSKKAPKEVVEEVEQSINSTTRRIATLEDLAEFWTEQLRN